MDALLISYVANLKIFCFTSFLIVLVASVSFTLYFHTFSLAMGAFIALSSLCQIP